MADTTSISCEYSSYGQTRYASAGSGPQSPAEHLSLQLAGVSVLEASVTAVLLFELHLGSRFVPPLLLRKRWRILFLEILSGPLGIVFIDFYSDSFVLSYLSLFVVFSLEVLFSRPARRCGWAICIERLMHVKRSSGRSISPSR